MLLQDCVDSGVNALPLGEHLLENIGALGREKIEALLALVLFAPFADQQALRFQAAQQWIQSALIDGHTMLGQSFAQGVAILLGAELRQDRDDQGNFLVEVLVHCPVSLVEKVKSISKSVQP